jgi:outer membrane lipoprotein-sorting protein
MKKIILMFFIMFAGTNLFAQEVSIDQILANIEKKDSSIQDLSVDYTQLINYYSVDEKQTSYGDVKFQKQNNLCIVQKKPQLQYTYIDGKKMTVFVPANNQAIVDSWKSVLKNDIIVATMINFSKNWKQLKKTATIELSNQTDNDYVLLIKPIENEGWKLFVNVDKQNYLINETVFDNGNFSINVTLKNYRTNIKLKNSLFKFVPDKDTEVIEL